LSRAKSTPSTASTIRQLFAAPLAAPAILGAQSGSAPPAAHPDYAKADLIRTSGAFVVNATVNPVWLQDSTRFYYRSASPKGEPVVYLIGPVKRTKVPLFDNVHLAEVMSLAGDTIFEPTKIPNFRLSDDERALKFNVSKRQFECTIATYACMVTDTAKVVKPDTPTRAVLSPDKKGTRTIRIRGRRSPAGEMRSCADWIGYYN
jgi:hypothetical protein